MNLGYTRTEAEALVNQLFETQVMLGQVPRYTRGRVIAALDVGDHWNVLIEWERPHLSVQLWYDKFDVQQSMRALHSHWSGRAIEEETETIEIRSSHDLSAQFTDARRTGRHSYQVECSQFDALLLSWQNDKRQRSGPLGLPTLAQEHIWITSAETKQVTAAIKAKRHYVTLD